MLGTASDEIGRAAEAERRRRGAGRERSLVADLDALLFELEELNVRCIPAVPADCRQRAAELISEVFGETPKLPEAVLDLMDLVYEAQDVALLARRRAGWGMAHTPPGRTARAS